MTKTNYKSGENEGKTTGKWLLTAYKIRVVKHYFTTDKKPNGRVYGKVGLKVLNMAHNCIVKVLNMAHNGEYNTSF